MKRNRTEYYQSEEYRAKKREYYQKQKEKVLRSNKAWMQTLKGRLLSYKRSALQRNIVWNLSDTEFESYWQKPCTYCGSHIDTIGIDRIDSSEDYSVENCIPCCSQCNKMKLDLSQEEFLKQVQKIYIHTYTK